MLCLTDKNIMSKINEMQIKCLGVLISAGETRRSDWPVRDYANDVKIAR